MVAKTTVAPMVKKFDPAGLPPSPDLKFEANLWASGSTHPAGVDEAGRGAWAGPVTAGAVILPPSLEVANRLFAVRDSKQMLPKQRAYWAEEIRTAALGWGVGFASNEEIDELGIIAATRLAMRRALEALPLPPDHLLIDALPLPAISLPQTILIKGDARSLSIAAASVLAKTARDQYMVELDCAFPDYGFARHKGYGTRAHSEALLHAGPCAAHRRSFAPINQL